jgi:hypothetical protein
MKDIEKYWNELRKIVTPLNMTLSDKEESDLLAQFNEEEKDLFKMILQEMDETNDFNSILLENFENPIKRLISLLLENPNFIDKVKTILLEQSLK